MAKVVVYGTLRKGQRNHYYLRDEKFIGEFESEPVFSLYAVSTYPGLIQNGNTSVKMEVYEVDELKMKQLDTLEGYSGKVSSHNLYERKNMITPFGMAKVYLYNQTYKKTPLITSGDWVDYNSLNTTAEYVQNSN